jgi:hypothetical protein
VFETGCAHGSVTTVAGTAKVICAVDDVTRVAGATTGTVEESVERGPSPACPGVVNCCRCSTAVAHSGARFFRVDAVAVASGGAVQTHEDGHEEEEEEEEDRR